MKVAFSTGRPAHVLLPANLLTQRGIGVTIYSAAYRSRFRCLAPAVRLKWVPQLVPSFQFLTGVQLPRPLQRADTAVYDSLCRRCIASARAFASCAGITSKSVSAELRESLSSCALRALQQIKGANTYTLYSQVLDSILETVKDGKPGSSAPPFY